MSAASDHDLDLDAMDTDELRAEVRRLRAGVRAHRDSSGQDLCWFHPQLWELLPETERAEIEVPEWPQFLRGCLAFRQSLEDELADAPRITTEFDSSART